MSEAPKATPAWVWLLQLAGMGLGMWVAISAGIGYGSSRLSGALIGLAVGLPLVGAWEYLVWRLFLRGRR
jgi:hypothetical protein